MRAIRYDISAYTASFRLPGLMGYQATSPVPPPSTIFGLLSAAAGRDVLPDDLEWIAYRFDFATKSVDLEKIIAFSEKGPHYDANLGGVNTVPIKREFLYSPSLVLYLPPNTMEEALMRPRYPICLGRSQDVATVDSITGVELTQVEQANLKGVLIPFPAKGRSPGSAILSFPTFMRTDIPRTPGVVKMFHVVTMQQSAALSDLYVEEDGGLGVPLLRREFLNSGPGVSA